VLPPEPMMAPPVATTLESLGRVTALSILTTTPPSKTGVPAGKAGASVRNGDAGSAGVPWL
jgi:hypothetical protein